ncbi:MAG: M20/M25/M40 family metallo-hydrolase [Kordiimonas sp.]
MKYLLRSVAAAAMFSFSAQGAENVDLDIVNKIRDEGFNHSKVMETLKHLTDDIGPRLTGTPAMIEANNWTKERLTEWGLENARLEGFEFGYGWTSENIEVHLTAPRRTQLTAAPIAWYPGTDGLVEGEAVHAVIQSEEDFEEYKGKLKGKIVFVDSVPDQKEPSNKVFKRLDKKELKKSKHFHINTGDPHGDFDWWVNYKAFGIKLEQFLAAEGAIAVVHRASRKGMLMEGTAYGHDAQFTPTIPGIEMAFEHYVRAVRLMDAEQPVKLSLKTDVTFYKDDTRSYSTLADIPGKGRRPGVVMAGAHLDSWHGADGAVDNAAGVAVVMEAVRILKAIGVEPKRTIRVGLWGGEEQGYFGSHKYVQDYLASRPESEEGNLKFVEPYAKQYNQFPIELKPEHERFSAYFNLDNGSGKIRGVYTEGNVAVAPIFKEWLEPFHDLGANTITNNTTGGTDHEPFDEIGVPGFQFIQDPMDYGSRLHHTQIDTYGNAYEKDLKQASVIMASFLYNTAMRDERLPRKPMPKPAE